MFIQKKQLHDHVKRAAGELPVTGLRLMDNRARQPARTNDAIRLAEVPDQFQKGARRRRAVRVHVTDQIRVCRKLEAFDERAALADGLAKFQRVDGGKFRRDAPDHAERVVACSR